VSFLEIYDFDEIKKQKVLEQIGMDPLLYDIFRYVHSALSDYLDIPFADIDSDMDLKTALNGDKYKLFHVLTIAYTPTGRRDSDDGVQFCVKQHFNLFARPIDIVIYVYESVI
jgi:hypothetical protein